MKKILSILAAIGLSTTSTTAVIACTEPGGTVEPPIVKQELTDELLKEFVKENNVINYTGPFLFEEDHELYINSRSNDSMVIAHLALEKFYDLINEHFNYDGYSFLAPKSEFLNKIKLNLQNDFTNSFEISFRYRSNNEFNEEGNDWLFFQFNFQQSEKYIDEIYLNTLFNNLINLNYFENNKGISTSLVKDLEKYNIVPLEITTSDLVELEHDKESQLSFITDSFNKALLVGEKDSTSLDLVNIEIINFNLLDNYKNEYHDAYSLDLKLSLKNDETVFIQRKINTILAKN